MTGRYGTALGVFRGELGGQGDLKQLAVIRTAGQLMRDARRLINAVAGRKLDLAVAFVPELGNAP